MPTGKLGGKATFKLTLEPALKAIRLYWQGKLEPAVLREGHQDLLELLPKHGYSKLLIDLRSAEVPREEDETWLTEYWLPLAKEAGLQTLSIVEPSRAVMALSVQKTSRTARKLGLETKFFPTLKAARFWIAVQ